MNRNNLLVCSLTATLIMVLDTSPPSKATPIVKAPAARTAVVNQIQPQVFTVRYVCFVAQPNKTGTLRGEVTLGPGLKVPAALMDLQNGSRNNMDTTPEGFVNKLRTAQPDHHFQVLLCGSFTCVNGSPDAASINVDPQLNDAFQCTLSEKMFLVQNSPVMLTLHHTGRVRYTEGRNRGGIGWTDAHTDNIVIGRTYSQGIDQTSGGRCFVYAFCVFPGRLDQTASAWSNAVKMLASHKATAHSKTAMR